MLLSKYVYIIINSSNISHYINNGYDVKVKDKIKVNVNDLTHGSGVIVECKCDVCDKNKNITFKRYIENIQKYNIFSCSRKCSNIKRKKTNLEKYGVENISQNNNIKEKKKKTILKNYGVDNPLKSEIIKNKIKETNLDKYGCESVLSSDLIRNKIKETNLDKYGIEYPIQSNEIFNKSMKTNIEKYGNEIYMLTDDFKNKSKKTLLKNYGVEHPMMLKEIKDKIKQTNLERYGVNSYTKTEEYKEKTKQTNLKKYGVEYPNQNINIRYKSNKTRKKNRLNQLKQYNIIDINYDANIYTFECDCEKNHNFDIEYNTLKNRLKYNIPLCTKCNDYKNKSGDEINVLNFIKENYKEEIIFNSRNIINKELDIYLPDLRLAFEFNGLYWHSELYKDKNYHLNKTEECEKHGIQLIHIYEDDWLYKQDIVKSMILNKLGKSNKIYARKTIIKEVTDNKLIREFLDNNHIQGFVGSKVKIGLFFNNELVSLMTFGNRRVAMGKKSTNEGEFELLRFCNKLNTNVIGGSSKLFKYFINNYQPKEITTYADRSFSQGKLYETLGFEFKGKTQPNYYYVIDGIRKHRFNFRKDKLIKEGFDPNKTEHQIMIDRKIYRIFDSGNLKYIFFN